MQTSTSQSQSTASSTSPPSSPTSTINPLRLTCLTHGSQLTHICLDRTCQNHTLLCSSCQPQHRGHITMPISGFIEQIGNCRSDETIVYLTNSYKDQLDRMRGNCLGKVQGLRKCFSERLDEVEVRVTRYFDAAQQSLMAVVDQYAQSVPAALEEGEEQEEDQPRIVKRISSKVKEYLANREAKAMISSKLQQSICRVEVEQQIIHDLIENPFTIMKDLVSTIEKTLGSLTLKQDSISRQDAICLPLTKWNTSLKHPSIQLQNSIATKSTPSKSLQQSVCVMSMRTLNPLPSTTYQWTFKILKLTDRINLGMALQTHTKLHNFVRWDWCGLGHGHYLISSYGRSTSHSNAKINGKFKAFEYGAGDVLRFVYAQQVLTVTKNPGEKQKEFRFEVVQPPEGDPYRAVAYLENMGDSVQLLEE